MLPWRLQPTLSNQDLAAATGRGPTRGVTWRDQPSNHPPEDAGSKAVLLMRASACFLTLFNTYTRALRTSRGVRSTRWW